jgi:hypothetical protein
VTALLLMPVPARPGRAATASETSKDPFCLAGGADDTGAPMSVAFEVGADPPACPAGQGGAIGMAGPPQLPPEARRLLESLREASAGESGPSALS